MAYLTAAQVRDVHPVVLDGRINDVRLDDLIAEFAEIAEQYRGVAYELRYAVETFLPARTIGALALRHSNVRSITSVVTTTTDGTETTLDSTSYQIDGITGVLVVSIVENLIVTVTYTHGLGSREVTDGVTATDTSLVSATAAFTVADIGKPVTGAGIPGDTTLSSVTNATTVVLSKATTATATSVTVTIGGPPDLLLRACREYVRSCAVSDHSNVPRDVIAQTFDGGLTRFSTPDAEARRPTGYLEVDRLLNSLDDYRPDFA